MNTEKIVILLFVEMIQHKDTEEEVNQAKKVFHLHENK
jgi:hypothetical protein